MTSLLAPPFPDSPLHSIKPDCIAIKNDYLKFLYASMLLEFSPSEVRQFWDKHTFPYAGDPPSVADLYHWIWQEDAFSNVDYFLDVLDSLEPFLVSRGVELTSFIRNTLHKINRGLIVSPKSMFKWSSPFIELFFSSHDLHNLILSLTEYYTSILAPGVLHRPVKHKVNENSNQIITTLLISRLRTKAAVFDPLPPFECEIWAALLVQMIPSSMHLQPFELLSVLADLRPVNGIVPETEFQDGSYYIGRKKYGVETTFHDFCSKNGLIDSLQEFSIPDAPVTEIIEDLFCSRRNRIVLHKGCVYGAPVGLYNLTYTIQRSKPKGFFSTLIDDAVNEASGLWIHIQARHKELLESIKSDYHCIYHAEDESLSVNGRHLVKSIPAKILRHILVRYTRRNQTDFEYREIIKDPDIILDTFNPNLAVRIRRLAKVLEAHFPCIQILRADRGKFSIKVTCTISYSEE